MGNVLTTVRRRFRQNRRFRLSSQVSPSLAQPPSVRRRTTLTPVVSPILLQDVSEDVSEVVSPVVSPSPIPQPPIEGVIPSIGSILLSNLIRNAPLPPDVTRPVLPNRNLEASEVNAFNLDSIFKQIRDSIDFSSNQNVVDVLNILVIFTFYCHNQNWINFLRLQHFF
ncbi:hypothetical protein RCL1_007362 [Eukaryota sp. TZLM3-RCL]